jgi:vacuolar iron transporter family protein
VIEHHHRDVQGGTFRAAVFGVSDGLVTNVGLVLGVAGAHPAPGVVRLAGILGLVSGAFSMAAGEYVSMKAQQELLERELALEEREIHRHPDAERHELAAIYRERGLTGEMADQLAEQVHRDPGIALETHAREELGIDPGQLGAPVRAALSSFVAFGIGAIVPLVPWFIASGTGAGVASVLLGAVAAVLVGVLLARMTGRPPLRVAVRQLAIAAVAAGVGYLVGQAVPVKSPT